MVRFRIFVCLAGSHKIVTTSLGVLVKIVREHQMEHIISKLTDFSGGKDEELRDIAGLGMCGTVPCDSNLLTCHHKL